MDKTVETQGTSFLHKLTNCDMINGIIGLCKKEIYKDMTNESQEIDLIQMMFAILRRWRLILVWTVAMGILFGVAKFGLGALILFDEEETQQKITEYKNLVEFNKQAKSASRQRMNTLSKSIDEEQDYVSSALYMKIDPYDVNVAKTQYYVKTDYTIMPGMTYQNVDRTEAVVDMYVTLLRNEDFLQGLCDSLGVELRYLQDLIGVSNGGGGILDIEVIAPTPEQAMQIMDYLVAGIDSNKKIIKASVDDYSISLISSSQYKIYSEEILARQQERKDNLAELMKDYAEEQKNYQEFAKEIIEEPEVTPISLIKGSIKMGIIGAVLGVLLVGGYVAVLYAVGNRLYSARELEQRYGINITGVVTQGIKKNLNGLDWWIRNCEERPAQIGIEDASAYQMTAAYVCNEIRKNAKILVVGQAMEECISKVSEMLGNELSEYTFINGGSLLNNSKGLTECVSCDAVVLVEQEKTTRYSDVKKEMEIINRYNKKVVGCIVVEQ